MKNALVTGGSKGIGKAICTSLQGLDKLWFTYCETPEDEAQALAESLQRCGTASQVIALKLDGRDRLLTDQTALQLAGAGVDILINNAAIADERPFTTIDAEQWDDVFNCNLWMPFRLSQLLVPVMADRGWGRVINIASIGGQWGGFYQVHYAAAKAALINLTLSLSKLYASRGITSNAVSPGLVATRMSEHELQTQAGLDKVRHIPIGRVANVYEVANVVKFLVSQQASYVTGQVINVNGGMLA